MANNLDSNFSQIVLKKFMKGWENDLVLSKTVNTQLVADGDINPNTGDTIWVKRPHQYRSVRTSDGDVTGETPNEIVSGKAPAIVQDYITVEMEYSQLEQAIKLNQLEEVLAPARQRIVTDLETSLATFMKNNAAHHLGAAGTQLSKWSDVSQCSAFMHSFGFPRDRNNWCAAINPFAASALADAQGGLAMDGKGLVSSAWENARISQSFGGVKAMVSDSLSSHTNGAAVYTTAVVASAPDQSYLTGKDTYTMVLALSGLDTTGVVNVGDQISIAGINWLNQQTKDIIIGADGNPIEYTATVKVGGTAAGGALSVTVTAPAFFDGATGQYEAVDAVIAGGEVVTVVSGAPGSTNQPNLFYHKDAIGLATVQLPRLHATESAVGNLDGFSIRVHRFSDGRANKQQVRFDILPAFAAFNPMLLGRFYGTGA